MPRLRTLEPQVRAFDTRTVHVPGKQKDPFYNSPEFRTWRAAVVQRAGGRCEAVDAHGLRCTKAQPDHRMYADHIRELKDNGRSLDLSNGQCLCASHHELKTMKARVRRLQYTGGTNNV